MDITKKLTNSIGSNTGTVMKTLLSSVLLFSSLTLTLSSVPAHAGLLKDLDSLGGNNALLERAQKLQPEKKVGVVQNRIVDRTWRNEFYFSYENFVGGDTNLNSQSAGVNYQLHINPYVSVGGSYYRFANQFSPEGRFRIDNAEDGSDIPDVDFLQDSYEFSVQAYPMYGKFSLLNFAVVHFDIYALGSYGKMNTDRGDSDIFSVGGGVGLWFSKYITSRFEIRQRFFTGQRVQGPVDLNITAFSFSLGFLL